VPSRGTDGVPPMAFSMRTPSWTRIWTRGSKEPGENEFLADLFARYRLSGLCEVRRIRFAYGVAVAGQNTLDSSCGILVMSTLVDNEIPKLFAAIRSLR
jgi:hypothetical protein